MIDAPSIKDSLVTLAKKIESTDYGAAVRLRLLSDAVEGGLYAEAWCRSDIYKLINPDIIVERYRSQQASGRGYLIEVLELTRSVFIFVPIIITWLGISQATSKYHELLSQCLKNCPAQVSQPFLYLWEQGFGGRLPDVLRLSSIGLIDATILAIIFALTIIVTLLANVTLRQQDLRAQILHANLVHAIAGATLCLLDRPPRPTTSGDTLALEAAKQLDTMTKQIATQFADVFKQFNRATAEYATIEKEFSGQLQESFQQLSAVGQLVGGANKLSIEMKTATGMLQEADREVSKSLNLLVELVMALSLQQQNRLDTADESATYLQDAMKKLSDHDTQ